MQILVKTKNVQVSESLKSYIETKVGNLDRFMPNIHEARVDLAARSAKSAQDRQVAQITLHSGDGAFLRTEESSSDLRASLDIAIEKMERQIKKYKGKHWNPKSRAQEEPVHIEEEPEDEVQVVRTKQFSTRPMDVDEAIDQMEMLGHDFFVFFNAGTDSFAVVYRRRADGYGLLLPELA